MKKICFALVLSIASVFSISAQTTNQPAPDADAANKVKNDSVSAKNESEQVKTTGPNDEPNAPAAEKKVILAETEKSPVSETQKQPATTEIKLETAEAVKKPEVAETTGKAKISSTTQKSDVMQPKLRVIEPAVNDTGLPILQTQKSTLGPLSTGNLTIDGYIEEFSALYGVDALLIYAQMNQESSFKGRATSPKGASGFMQLMPDTARRFGVTNIYNPKQNIKAGVKYMRWLLDKFGGDMRLALAGYNAGEGSVLKYGNKVPPYRETQNYVARIMNHYELLSNQSSTLALYEQK